MHEDHHATPVLDAVADLKRRKALDGPTRVDRAACLLHAKRSGRDGWLGPWIKTHFGPGKLTVDEFLYYRLYRDRLSDDERSRFVGKQVQNRVHFLANDPDWLACVHDKLLYQTILQAHGLPAPELRAVYGRGASRSAPWRCLQNDEQLHAFLRSPDNYPVFAKPAQGMYSVGAMLLDGLDGDDVVLGHGRRAPVARIASYIKALDKYGYLFQTPLSTHPALVPSLGEALPSARIMVLLDGERHPKATVATLKLPLGGHDADNFWRTGNVLAPVDVDSGRVGDAITGAAHELRRVIEHPESGASLEGLTLPDWESALRSVSEAAVQFPGLRTQGWDVCFSARGPLLLELNFGGDLNLHQLAHDRGLLDETFCRHLRGCGYRRKLPDGGD